MDEVIHHPGTTPTAGGLAAGSRQDEISEIVSTLEHSLVRIDALGLTLAAALLDRAVSETKRHRSD
jgi:hypothetical protein